MAANVTDASLLFEVIAGHDPRDSTSLDCPYRHIPDPEIRGVKIGVPEEFFGEGVDPRVASVVWDAISLLER
ncbi:amidase family protein, partial [Klebsiella pneumoniae]|uniref:amidase family protein n=1 Tax=Klebsiella pneumoniae TaxID=573 RepID=UPI00272F6402